MRAYSTVLSTVCLEFPIVKYKKKRTIREQERTLRNPKYNNKKQNSNRIRKHVEQKSNAMEEKRGRV